jgi:hypothetical protein
MVGEEQQRIADIPSEIRTCRVSLGTYGDGVGNHFVSTVLPYKKVLAVLAVNLDSDTNYAIPIRVLAPNVLHTHMRVSNGDLETGAGALNTNAEVVCVVPHK